MAALQAVEISVQERGHSAAVPSEGRCASMDKTVLQTSFRILSASNRMEKKKTLRFHHFLDYEIRHLLWGPEQAVPLEGKREACSVRFPHQSDS